MDTRRLAALTVVIAAVLWGSIGIFTRFLNGLGLDSVQITEVRCMVTAAVLIVTFLIRDRSLLRISPKDIWLFFGTGVCSIVFFNVCYFTTIEMLTLSAASVLLYTAPCMVMLMSVVIFKERLTRLKLLALVAAFGGCVLTTGIIGGVGEITAAGVLIGLGFGFGYALYSIFGRLAADRYSALTVTAYTFIVAAVCLLPFASPLEIISAASEGWTAIAAMLLLGIAVTLVPYALYTWGLERMEPGRASVIAFAEPMVATIIGIAVFGEVLTPAALAGIVLILASVILLSRPDAS